MSQFIPLEYTGSSLQSGRPVNATSCVNGKQSNVYCVAFEQCILILPENHRIRQLWILDRWVITTRCSWMSVCLPEERKKIGTSSSLFNAAFGPQDQDPESIDIQTIIDMLTQDWRESGGDVANYPNVRDCFASICVCILS
jgi:hypothetical protein